VPDVPRALARLPDFPYVDDDTMTTYFTGREIPVASERADLAAWQEPIFLLLTKFSANAADYFCLPPKQCVELATKIEI